MDLRLACTNLNKEKDNLSPEDEYFHFKRPLCPWTLSATGGWRLSQNVFTIPTNKSSTWVTSTHFQIKRSRSFIKIQHPLSEDAKENEKKEITKGRNVFHRLSISFIGFVFWEFLEPPLLHVHCVSHCYTGVSITKSDILVWKVVSIWRLYSDGYSYSQCRCRCETIWLILIPDQLFCISLKKKKNLIKVSNIAFGLVSTICAIQR